MTRAPLPKFRTALSLGIFDGDEVEFDLVLAYSVTPGMKPSHDDPGSPVEVSYETIRLIRDGNEHHVPLWIANIIERDEDLQHSVLADWQERQDEARERVSEDSSCDRATARQLREVA